ncbi:hypothetical protein BC827DRAFT_1174355, partial [Russula dissimulans]
RLFSTAFTLERNVISVNSTWESMRLFSSTSLFVSMRNSDRLLDSGLQELRAPNWDEMVEAFQMQVSELYRDWETYFKLHGDLDEIEHGHYQSIIHRKASSHEYAVALRDLSTVIVLIDEYETPFSSALQSRYLEKVHSYFHIDFLFLPEHYHKALGILAGITPSWKSGVYSGMNNLRLHPLHHAKSIFAGMVMFTTDDVLKLIRLSKSTLKFEDLKEHYDSYLAASEISVYNPVSICSALETNTISNYWISTEINTVLLGHVIADKPILDHAEIITLLYYAGYLTMTKSGRLKIPNKEVLDGWLSDWITRTVADKDKILLACVDGPVSDFVDRRPSFMQATLNAQLVTKNCGALSPKIPERLYHVFLLGLLRRLPAFGWEADVEPEWRAGHGFGFVTVDIRITSTQRRSAVLIKLNSSGESRFVERDADRALKEIESQNYNFDQLNDIDHLREYGIANFQLESVVKGRYLVRSESSWVERNDLAVQY